jgi:tetratricopeptide (TPR) repeat protein
MALHDFEEALRSGPDDPDALLGRAAAGALLGRPDEAVADVARALRADPRAPRTLYNSARAEALAAAAFLRDGSVPRAAAARGRAVRRLREAAAATPADDLPAFWDRVVRHDPVMAELRETAEFAALASEIRSTGRARPGPRP